MSDTTYQPATQQYGGKDYLSADNARDWFYVDHPLLEGDGRILTDLVDPTPGQWIVKAMIFVGDTLVATGYADTNGKGKRDSLGKVETAAIRRALLNAGYSLKKIDHKKVRTITTPTETRRGHLNQANGRAVNPPATPSEAPELKASNPFSQSQRDAAAQQSAPKPVNPLSQHKPQAPGDWLPVLRIQRIKGLADDFPAFKLYCAGGQNVTVDNPGALTKANVRLEAFETVNRMYDVSDGLYITVKQSDGVVTLDQVRLDAAS